MEKTEILRVVVRENMTETLIDRLISDLVSIHTVVLFPFHLLTLYFGVGCNHRRSRSTG